MYLLEYILMPESKKNFRVWPPHVFMKLIIFGMCSPCPSTGVQLRMRVCGHVHPWHLMFPLPCSLPPPTDQYSFHILLYVTLTPIMS